MQTETTALLILLIAIIFALKEKRIYNVIAAFFISLLFFLKGITLLYSIIVLIVMLLNKKPIKQIIGVIIFSSMFLILEIVICYKIEPSFIIDMYLSTQYITESWKTNSLVKYIIEGIVQNFYVGIGFFCLCINTKVYIRNRNIKMILLEVMSWIILFFGVYIQRLMYVYQIALMIPACLVSIFITIYYYKCNNIQLNKFVKIIIILYIISISIAGTIKELENTIQIHLITQENERIIEALYDKYPDLKDEEVLYIGNGLSAYYFKNKSYIKYTTTIYLANNNQTYLESENVEKLKQKIKEYKGKYIIIDDIEWETKKRLSDDVIEYIENNYHFLQSTDIMIYEGVTEEYSSIYIRNE